jgi:hypothetical protein
MHLLLDAGKISGRSTIGEDLRPISRLAFTAGKDVFRTSLTQEAITIARIRARPRSLSRQSATGTLGSITTSGWVMKNTAGID